MNRVFKLPAPPLRLVGPPGRRDVGLCKQRFHRASYDWRMYTPGQLRLMEKYWDDCVSLFLSLLPKRFAEDPSRYRGINLGTFNGAYQKAWMRRGFSMYGVDYGINGIDIISELHEYGCKGHRGDFYSMPEIANASFDFAIIDRAMCNKPNKRFYKEVNGYYIKQSPDKPTSYLSHPTGKEVKVPPYFSDIFRILKPEGAFLNILYHNWSDHVLRELNAYGEMACWPIKRPHPYLAVVVDRTIPSRPFPLIDPLVDRIRNLKGDVEERTKKAVEILNASDLVYSVKKAENTVRFLSLLNNHIVTLDLTAGVTVTSDEFWQNAKHQESFFYEDLSLKFQGKKPRSNKRLLVIFSDPNSWGNNTRKITRLVKLSENKFDTFIPDKQVRGIVHIKNSLSEIDKMLSEYNKTNETIILMNTLGFDAKLSPRNHKLKTKIDVFQQNLREVLVHFINKGARPVLLPSIPLCLMSVKMNHELTKFYKLSNDIVFSFDKYVDNLANELGCTVLNLPKEIAEAQEPSLYSEDGSRLSTKGLIILEERLCELLLPG